jgi:hypothetical protein
MSPYDYKGADALISDFFDEIERVFQREGIEFSFDDHDVELEDEDGEDVSG